MIVGNAADKGKSALHPATCDFAWPGGWRNNNGNRFGKGNDCKRKTNLFKWPVDDSRQVMKK
ncbi:hypothetical protein CDQ84_10485 [Clostridium thermosuccinogenes]|jgi:hypothetical protein|uniref:Uncharacterized protein n=1 Tax=Clostridium thermosuccinogenes TaxID=84032 RepID=A0A2K2FIP3_9CLOT|nr:hypothetical protein CDO33_17960 [Pseudoclostridium thermosuccinogenes]PNT96852.1 hypothetical protein CDQ85_10330 [Pseudoclostridium thermosuccinogenes]PNT98662.1 hypothetical protein CDQ84_10485 [Pseudoclostridium thermosuccinogenes]